MGRKTKLTPKVQEDIVRALTIGATHDIACQYVGIHPDTFYDWLKKGEAGRAPYAEFAEAVKGAESRAVVGWLVQIEQAARSGTWQAAAWKLERRYPKIWGRQVIEHTGPQGPIEYVLKVVYESEVTARKRLTTRLEHLGQRYGEDGAEA